MAAGALMLAHDHSLPEDFSALLTLADGAASPVTPGAPFAASATTRPDVQRHRAAYHASAAATQEYAPIVRLGVIAELVTDAVAHALEFFRAGIVTAGFQRELRRHA